MSLRSYSNTLSYRPGDAISVHVDGDAQDVAVSMKRLVHSRDASTDIDVPWDAAGSYRLRPQTTCVGGFATGAVGISAVPTVTFGAFFWLAATDLPGPQTVLSLEGDTGWVRLEHEAGQLALRATAGGGADAVHVLPGPVRPGVWYLAVATVRADRLVVRLVSTDPLRGESHAGQSAGLDGIEALDLTRLTVAAHHPHDVTAGAGLQRGRAEGFFTGKIEQPFVATASPSASEVDAVAAGTLDLETLFAGDLVAAWDLSPYSAGDDPNHVLDRVSGRPVSLVNLPVQAVTGRSFDGSSLDYRSTPEHYGAVHFHSTDLADAGWEPLFESRLPDDLPSGVYGIELRGSDSVDLLPLFVVPHRGARTGRRAAFVVPTFSYLAYANEELYAHGEPSSWTSAGRVEISEEDAARAGDPTYGLSQYDKHHDGSGVVYSSARRCIANMRRGYRMWLNDAGRGFSADMYLVEWLESRGIEYDVLTDLEVHEGGADVLAPYAAVLSGMHPEYTSSQMLDAYQSYRDGGGGLLYLGGNGWYWVTDTYSREALTTEIRRGHAGILTWTSYPGEVTLLTGRQPGGLWKYRGRAPQRLVGIGMAAQGWGRSYPYYRSEDAECSAVSWILDGVEDDPIGAYGMVMGGAAGDEIDRVDEELGTPYHAVVVASSRDHDNFYQRVPEEVGMTYPSPHSPGGEDDPEVHSDIVYFRTPGGGEVFSAGSMAWSGALVVNGGENGVSRMTENVLRRFIADRS